MKIAVITGTSSGIGESISNLLLSMGFKVYGISRTPSKNLHENFIWIRADITDPNSFAHIFDSIKENSVDILVNNAGTAFERGALNLNEESFERIFDLNFKAPILLTSVLKEKLQKGIVVNISSVSDRLVGENHALYCSSKAALNTYFDVVALEEKNIRIVSILPSYVDTPLLKRLHKNNKDFDWSLPMKPHEIADFIGQIINQEKDIPSGAKVIVAPEALKEDFLYDENLWGYNTTKKILYRLDQRTGESI